MRLFGQRASRSFAALALIGGFVGSGAAVVLANSAPEAGATPLEIPCPAPLVSGTTATVTCSYVGEDQFWTVPAGVTQVTFTAYGAAGVDTNGRPVGFGGVATNTLAVGPGMVLTVVAGGQGQGPSGGAGGAGGFGGGGAGGATGGGGGGASSVSDGTNTLIVAGGGGGTGGDDPISPTAGQGGGTVGFDGAGYFLGLLSGANGTGGTQTGGGLGGTGGGLGGGTAAGSGSLGQGGAGANNGGGGGGGYYGGGGGGGSFTDPGAQGGGGSGFITSSGFINGSFPTVGNSNSNGTVVISYPVDDLTLSQPVNITTSATGPDGAVVTYPPPTVSDPDDTTPPSATCGPSSGSIFPIGSTTVTCSASDPADSFIPVSVSFTVTVIDDDLTLSQPANITTGATGPSGAVVNYALPTASDPDDPTTALPAPTCSPGPGSTFAIGTTLVTCTVDLGAAVTTAQNEVYTDSFNLNGALTNLNTDAGNLATDTAAFDGVFPALPGDISVLATDASAPNVTAIDSDVANVDLDLTTLGTALGSLPAAIVSDQLAMNADKGAVDTYVAALTTDDATLAAAQAAVNDSPSSVSVSFTVTVVDDDLTLSQPKNITTSATGPGGAVVNYPLPTASDPNDTTALPAPNCSPAPGSTFAIGTTPVTCTVDLGAAVTAAQNQVDADSSNLNGPLTALSNDAGFLAADTAAYAGDFPALAADASTLATDASAAPPSVATIDTDVSQVDSDLASLETNVGLAVLPPLIVSDVTAVDTDRAAVDTDEAALTYDEATLAAAQAADNDTPSSVSVSFTVTVVVRPGGVVTVGKTTSLIGNYPEQVSGTGWHADTTVTLNECASTAYSAATCDAANQKTVTLGTGKLAGIFKGQVIDLAVGVIDTNGDKCGVAGATTCYVVVVGNTEDATASGILSFKLPIFAVAKTTGVLGNYVDRLKASGFPIGDTIDVQECDGSVSVSAPSTVSTNCDNATLITGTTGPSGGVIFTTGLTMKVYGAYSDPTSGKPSPSSGGGGGGGGKPSGGAGGTGHVEACDAGNCAIAVTDANNPAIGLSTAVTFASPVVLIKKTTGVLGNYVDSVKAGNFPNGDTVTAEECDNAVTPANVATNCDSATAITGTAGPNGKVIFSALGVTVLVGSAYSDGASGAPGSPSSPGGGTGGTSGTVSAGGSCDIVINDSTQSGFFIAVPVGLAG